MGSRREDDSLPTTLPTPPLHLPVHTDSTETLKRTPNDTFLYFKVEDCQCWV
jgi:hypothetical protein